MTALTGKTVIVVGGASGIGAGIAREVAARGAEVVLVGRSRDRLAAAGGRFVVADVTRDADVAALFAEVPAPDHVVVTAADLRYGPIAQLAIETAQATIASKVLAAVSIAKHAAPRLRPGGSLLFTSGVASQRPAPNGSLVAMVNGALDAFARALAVELAPLRVNTLSPGWVDTPLWDRLAPELANAPKADVFARLAPRLPARRIGRPDELGHAAAFLLENDFTTGTTLFVDGGHRLA